MTQRTLAEIQSMSAQEIVDAIHADRIPALVTEIEQLREALRRTMRWVAKGIADDAFASTVSPHGAEIDLRFAQHILDTTQSP